MFQSLTVYQLATELRREVWKLTQAFPAQEKFRLSDQIVRSTRKCPAQLAEGHGRYHWQENIQYCRIARASLLETRDHLDVALECSYIDSKYHTEIDNRTERIIQMINGYIRFLQKQKSASNSG